MQTVDEILTEQKEIHEMRKNYAVYKDGLPIINLSKAQLVRIDKNLCIVVSVKGSKQTKMRIRKKPTKKLSMKQENTQLRKLLAKVTGTKEFKLADSKNARFITV